MKRILAVMCSACLLLTASISFGQTGSNLPSTGDVTGTVKEYAPGSSLVVETLAPNAPVQFKLAKTVTFSDTDGKTIEAAGLTTNRRVRVHYAKVGGDYVADKIS